MTPQHPTEKKFEDHIEKSLKQNGYSSVTSEHYDKNLCLIPSKLLEFIKSTQEKLILAVIQKNNNKLEIYILVTKDCFEYFTAKDIINNINKSIGSSGGGKDDLAQAGIDFNDNLSVLKKNISQIISEIIKNKGK